MTPILSIATDPPSVLRRALETLQRGGVLLFPTETVYGLGADSAQPGAVDRLYALKGRPSEKPFQWLTSSLGEARAASPGWNERAEKLARAFWPGPMTLVVAAGKETIGWRMPQHDGLLDLLRALGRPLVATSANPSGQPPARTCAEAIAILGNTIDLALDGGPCGHSPPSTVVSVVGEETRILRAGAISEADLRRVLS